MEPSESFRVVDALLKLVDFRFTNTHLAVHFEQAFASVVESV